MIFNVQVPNLKCSKGSGPRRATGLIPSERAPKTIGIDVEFILFHVFEPEISWDKGVSGTQTGGTPPEPTKCIEHDEKIMKNDEK